jgi:hypothetical protein
VTTRTHASPAQQLFPNTRVKTQGDALLALPFGRERRREREQVVSIA